MRTTRNVSFILLVLAWIVAPHTGVQALRPALGHGSTLAGRDCPTGSFVLPEPQCFRGCGSYGGCYLPLTTEDIGQGDAQQMCNDYLENNSCPGSAAVQVEDNCYYWCQYEEPAPVPAPDHSR